LNEKILVFPSEYISFLNTENDDLTTLQVIDSVKAELLVRATFIEQPCPADFSAIFCEK
jgi:hypothetical protein